MESITEDLIQKNSIQLHSKLSELINEIILLYKNTYYSNTQKHEKSKVLLTKLKDNINEFELSPKLLDTSIERYIITLVELYVYLYKISDGSTILTIEIAEVIYCFSKIRGFKIITQYFSSDVYILPFLIQVNNEVSSDYEIFLNLIWLSKIVLVPFQLEKINKELPMDLFNIGVRNVEINTSGSKNQLSASILLSRLLTRSDMLAKGLLSYYIISHLKPIWEEEPEARHQKSLGHLITLNQILKRTNINNLGKYLQNISDIIEKDMSDLRLIQSENDCTKINSLNIVYLIKVSNKLTNIYLDSYKYSKVTDFVNFCNEIINLLGNNFDSKLRFTIAKSLSNICLNLGKSAINYKEQLVIYFIKQLEIKGLEIPFSPFNKSDVTYNSFNPNIFIDSDNVQIPKFHTILLFLGFACLNKTLPQHLIPPVLCVVHKMLFFEKKTINCIIGTQLRDSSCFIIWALTRMISKENFRILVCQNKHMMGTILFDLIKVVIFDRDLVIRRCSVAAIQELIGRYGNIMFESCFETPTEVGKFIIQFIQVFNNDTTGTVEKSLDLINDLVILGFRKDVFLSLLLDNITNKNLSFDSRKLNVSSLKKIFPIKQINKINLNFYCRINFKTVESALSYFTNIDSSLFLSELLTISSSNDIITNNMTFILGTNNNDFRNASIEASEGYLKWMNYLLKQNLEVDSLWQNFFEIIKLNFSKDLAIECQNLFSSLTRKKYILKDDIFEKLCYYISNNNLILSSSIFFFERFNKIEISHLFDIIDSIGINFETKSNMIESLSKNLDHLMLDEEHYIRIVNLLDDYTITEQGDVGSKIRFATLKLIKMNLNNFIQLKNTIRLKLVRLSGEVIDRIRNEAFSLLCLIDGFSKDYSNDTISIYFENLFKYYLQFIHNKDDISLEFWRGVLFSLGSTTASQSLLRLSFIEFVKFVSTLGQDNQQKIYSYFLTLLKLPKGLNLKSIGVRGLKVYLVTLNVFVKLFECGMTFPETFDYNALFIRSYNLHLNTMNTSRITLVISIFQYLCMESQVPTLVSEKCCKRLIWISCNHPKAIIRNVAGDVLFEIINDRNSKSEEELKLIESIDWFETSEKLQRHIRSLENIYLKVHDTK